MDEPAFPGLHPSKECFFATEGLTKREYFACAAMQGILSGTYQTGERGPSDEALRWVAENSITFADALIAALKKEGAI